MTAEECLETCTACLLAATTYTQQGDACMETCTVIVLCPDPVHPSLLIQNGFLGRNYNSNALPVSSYIPSLASQTHFRKEVGLACETTIYLLATPNCERERLSSPRSMLGYVILLNIHKGIGYKFGVARCCTLTSTADSASCCTALPKVFSRHLQVYQCIRTHKSQQESMWVAKIMDYSSSCTHSYSY